MPSHKRAHRNIYDKKIKNKMVLKITITISIKPPDKIINIGMVYAECSETAAVLRAAPAM